RRRRAVAPADAVPVGLRACRHSRARDRLRSRARRARGCGALGARAEARDAVRRVGARGVREPLSRGLRRDRSGSKRLPPPLARPAPGPRRALTTRPCCVPVGVTAVFVGAALAAIFSSVKRLGSRGWKAAPTHTAGDVALTWRGGRS